MILQNIIYPSIDTCTEELMYFRRNGNVEYAWCNDRIQISKYGMVEFDTYFNGFSVEKWHKYTCIKNVSLNIVIQGSVRVTVMRKEKGMNGIITEFLDEQFCCTEQPAAFSFRYDIESMKGMLCFQLVGVKGKSYFYSGNYATAVEENQVHHVKIGLDICTYKRESYINNNLKILNDNFLNNEGSALHNQLEVFIADNAHTLDIAQMESEKIHIFPNKNVGGAGGFTRGMMEIKKVQGEKNITHILVMDDDVSIEPEALYRTYTMLSCLKEEYAGAFIGGAMLRLDTKYIQTESGAIWNGGNLISLKQGLDLRELDACLYNDMEEKAQYNAWWYCAFPADVVSETNLPLPLFIRGDDVEYGLRNMKQLILMNGICVWHEPFENKYSSFIYYYILRNQLIDNSVHHMILPKKAFCKLLQRWVMDEVRLYRYKNAHLIMRGVEDFLRGVDWLYKQDGESLHKSVMSEGYKMQYLEELDASVQFTFPMWEEALRAVPATGLKARVITHFTVNGHYLSTKRAYNIVPTIGAQQSSVYRTQMILNYDYPGRKGFVTQKDVNEAKNCVKRLKKLCKRLGNEYDIITKSFEKEAVKLMTERFWKGYLEV